MQAAGPMGSAPGPDGLDRARSRLCRSQILQENMRLKALAEIYKMHCDSFAPLSWDPSGFSKLFFRQNGPATAAPFQEGSFWKRSEKKAQILRVR